MRLLVEGLLVAPGALVAFTNLALFVRSRIVRSLGGTAGRNVSMTFILGSALSLIGLGIVVVMGHPNAWVVGVAVGSLVIDPASLVWLPLWSRCARDE